MFPRNAVEDPLTIGVIIGVVVAQLMNVIITHTMNCLNFKIWAIWLPLVAVLSVIIGGLLGGIIVMSICLFIIWTIYLTESCRRYGQDC